MLTSFVVFRFGLMGDSIVLILVYRLGLFELGLFLWG
jgi:hypothetical protein